MLSKLYTYYIYIYVEYIYIYMLICICCPSNLYQSISVPLEKSVLRPEIKGQVLLFSHEGGSPL